MKSNEVTIVRKTIKIINPKDMPRKKKKAYKKAMSIKWYEKDLDYA
jgi:hypothetical protein